MSIFTHLKCAAQNWGKQFDRKALILMYHRVTEVDADPWGLCVTPKNFQEQMEILAKSCRTLSLMEFNENLVRGKMPRRAVIVTFDDGYEDNLLNAKPILEKNGVLATFFLVSGQIGKQKEFWWDELERIFLKIERLPANLELNIDGQLHAWKLDDDSEGFPVDGKYSGWRTDMDPPTTRHSTYYAVWKLLQPMDESQKQSILDQLRLWAGTQSAVRSTHRTLTQEEVCTLAQSKLIEIGAHTVSHPMLSKFPQDVQRFEVEGSKSQLEEVINHQVETFAYPHGEYSKQTLAVLREAGFHCACSTAPEILKEKLDPLQLPRFQAMDWSGEEFLKRISEWFEEK
jgi:peptidoglycan/xylan/chitin deacetylase (PgdA/CDA1 family)